MNTVVDRPGPDVRASRVASLLIAFCLAALGVVAIPTSAHAEPVAAPSLSWKISNYYNTHLSTHTFAGGASGDADGVVTFPDGVGTFDPGNGTASIAYAGSVRASFVGAFGPGPAVEQYSVKITDPTVAVDAEGVGTISAEVSWSVGLVNPASPPKRVVLTRFDADAGDWTTSDGFRRLTATPDWSGVIPADSEAATSAGIGTGKPINGESFAPEFITELNAGLKPLFYASGSNPTSDANKAPAAFTAEAEAPATTVATTATSPSKGVVVRVSGTGFTGVTNPGDAGVYVGIAPAGGLPDVSSQEDMGNFAAAAWVPAASIKAGGSFAASLVAPKGKLNPELDYSVYTWRAHAHSTTSQDTEKPFTINWAALNKAELAVSLPSTATFGVGRTAIATSAVADGDDSPTGVVIARIGTKTVGTGKLNGAGVASVVLSKSIAPGSKSIVFSYAGDANLTAASPVTKPYKVAKGRVTSVGLSTTKKPTSSRTGKAVITVRVPKGSPAATGTVKITYKKSGSSRYATKWLSGGKGTLTLPKLSKGTWKVSVKYAGSSSYHQAPTTAKGSITIK